MTLPFQQLLVTGGAGFIGSNYVRHLCSTYPDTRVVVLDKLTYAGNRANLADLEERITFVHGAVESEDDVRRSIDGCDAVIHFAAESHVDRSLVNAMPFVRTNVEGTAVLLELAAQSGVKRFLHVSTDEVYGDVAGTNRLSLESDPFHPRSPYAATKAAAEHLVFAYGVSYGLDVVVTRGSNTYGPWQYPEKIVPLFATNGIDGLEMPIYGDGSAVRDYLHVEDHCTGVTAVLAHGESGSAYNLGARVEINGIEVADAVSAVLGLGDDARTFVRDRPGHDYRYAVDPSRAEALGWTRRWSFAEGLPATVDWYRQNETWWRAIKEKRAFTAHADAWYGEPPEQEPAD